MSREIKIRFWEKGGDKWFRHCLEIDKETFAHGDEVWLDIGEVVAVEQYTGLKDKNGKDIYEGDIITVMGYGTYIVFWREWDSSFSLKPIDTVKEENRVLMLCEDWESDYAVIGNIHENPELLGGKNE